MGIFKPDIYKKNIFEIDYKKLKEELDNGMNLNYLHNAIDAFIQDAEEIHKKYEDIFTFPIFLV